MKKAEELEPEEVKELPLSNEEGSLMNRCFLNSIGFMTSVVLFNEIGRVSESSLLERFKTLLLPSFPQLSYQGKTPVQEITSKQMEIISSIENNWYGCMNEPKNASISLKWIK